MQSIIFDIDGTLWDSTDVVADSWNAAIYDTVGIKANLDGDRLKQLFGKTMDEIGQAMLPMLDKKKRDEVCRICYKYEDEYLLKNSGVFYDGVRETIEKLAEKYDLYIASNCQAGYIETTMKYGNFADKIKDFICFDDTKLPKGENIKILMQRNNIKEAIYVGDIQGDFEASKVAGIPMIYASYGFGKVENPDYTITSIKELPDLMEKINKA